MPPRNRISLEQRKRIVRAFEDVHEDYLAIVGTIGVSRSTARGIVSRYVREGRIAERPRGGANHVRVDDAMRDCLDDIRDLKHQKRGMPLTVIVRREVLGKT